MQWILCAIFIALKISWKWIGSKLVENGLGFALEIWICLWNNFYRSENLVKMRRGNKICIFPWNNFIFSFQSENLVKVKMEKMGETWIRFEFSSVIIFSSIIIARMKNRGKIRNLVKMKQGKKDSRKTRSGRIIPSLVFGYQCIHHACDFRIYIKLFYKS